MRKTNNPIKHVRAIKARYEDLLLAWPGVMSVGVGLCRQDDAPTGEICIVVTVQNKRTTDNLSPDEALPDQIEGVQVDVQESGDIVPWVSLVSGGKAGNS
ncbi:MAG: hypothetical protein JXB07_11465 [Anaerolineae bacterium]|nr:hypothetical protein [Anaerolineae bacterium]